MPSEARSAKEGFQSARIELEEWFRETIIVKGDTIVANPGPCCERRRALQEYPNPAAGLTPHCVSAFTKPNSPDASHLIDVLSAVGKSLGTGIVTELVAAHSVPR